MFCCVRPGCAVLPRIRWFLGTVLALVCAQAPAGTFLRTDSGAEIPPELLIEALTRSGVYGELAAEEEVALPRGRVVAVEPSSVHLAISSEFVILAVLDGEVGIDGAETAEAGEAALWPVTGGAAEVHPFDAGRFLASASAVVPPRVRSRLQSLAEEQEDLVFWGVLRPTGVNAQSPTVPAVEALRRDALLHPVVVELRAAAGDDPARLAELAAARFVGALAARELEPVRSLLAPSLFEPGRRPPSDWLALRQGFAEQLLAGGLPGRLAGASVGEGDLAAGFAVIARDGSRYRLTLSYEDAMVFVTGLEPEG